MSSPFLLWSSITSGNRVKAILDLKIKNAVLNRAINLSLVLSEIFLITLVIGCFAGNNRTNFAFRHDKCLVLC